MGQLLEAVDNEILFSFILVVCCCLYIFSNYIFPFLRDLGILGSFFSRNNELHPDSEESINLARSQMNYPDRMENRERNNNDTCPICIERAHLPVETNCGHYFCGKCMVAYWTSGRWVGPVACPVCRTRVTILLKCYGAGSHELRNADENSVNQQINLYNRRFSGEPVPIMDQIRDIPVLLRHVISSLFTLNGISFLYWFRLLVLLVISVCYLLSPLDIIPEAAFGVLGLLDDVFIVTIIILYVIIIYRRAMSAPAPVGE